jgi:CheY-like chemotaxis protein
MELRMTVSLGSDTTDRNPEKKHGSGFLCAEVAHPDFAELLHAEEVVSSRTTSSRPPRITRERARVLVVDDEPTLRQAMVGLLRDEGYVVEEAGNGAVALEIALTFRPDVVLFDWAMPIADGRALVESLRESMRPLPGLVAVSAVSTARAWCQDNGVPFVVTKPFEDTTLIRAVDAAFMRANEDRRPRRQSPSGTRAIVRPACVIAVGEKDPEDALVDDLPDSLRHARIVAVDEPEDAEKILEMIVPDLVVVDDDAAHDHLRTLATSKAVPVLVRPAGTSSTTRMLVAEALAQTSRG